MFKTLDEARDDAQSTIDWMCEEEGGNYIGNDSAYYDTSVMFIELAKELGCKIPPRLEKEWGEG
jgi:hypothetical protein